MDKERQDMDFEWFVSNYAELFKKYGNRFLAIKNQSVLGAYPTYAEAVAKTEEKEPLGTFIVQHCNGEESGYTNYIASMNFMGAVG